ncbi:hypothetical protein C9I86_13175 [Photobacterium sp. NCIMB 13483]|uniref:Abi family protein n=1 Tax=Photobacterium sp. NCIMB 13483 TaxID=2022103 RepID=UPI000D17D2EB|nr:Abi family protein [Photobacterium sp. NCIMB 13483]PST87335.1 hypothetical protein C9I86_13175 [Photobacterium sp. NCIMB 13483]
MTSIVDYISAERLKSYEKILKISETEKQILAYQWSKSVVSSLLPTMQCLEVTLRNAINHSVVSNPPRAGKFVVNDLWFEDLAEYKTRKMQHPKIKIVKKKLNKGTITQDKYDHDVNKIKEKNKSWEEREILNIKRKIKKLKDIDASHSDIISGLAFGFWTNLLSEQYFDISEELLWPNLISTVFPNLPKEITDLQNDEQLKIIEDKVNSFRDLRNRMFHHEPIWKFYNWNDGKLDYSDPVYGVNASLSILSRVHNEMLTFIEWMSKERVEYLKKTKSINQFSDLCSKDGLNSFISHDDIDLSYTRTQAKRCKNKLIKDIIDNGRMIRVTKNGETLALVGRGNIEALYLL